MTRPARVLVLDDSAASRHGFTLILERGGFQVTTAATRDEALEHLATDFFHVLLLDVQLDPDDPDNREGLDLLATLQESKMLEAITVIMTSVWFKPEYILDTVRHDGVDYFHKNAVGEGDGLIAKVREVLRTRVHFNGELKILWQSDATRSDAVVGLRLGEKRLRRGMPEVERIGDELEDLLCRLFPSAVSVVVDVMHPGMSGSGVLWARSFGEIGAAEPVVVKFGDVGGIRQELERYQKYVEGFVGGNRSTTARGNAFTPHLGGIVYSFVGVEGDRLKDFSDLYQNADPDAICAFLQRLFNGTCGRWYGNRGQMEPLDLGADYRNLLWITPEILEKALAEKLQSVKPGPRLRFTSLSSEQTFRNPIPLISGRFIRSTVTAITHGDFNQHNILLDSRGEAWLIDFMRTGPGHILRDVAQLDSVVRFQLLTPNEATLDERLEMEQLLASTGKTDQVAGLAAASFAEGNPALRKAFETSVCLRGIAARLIQAGGLSDFSEYQIASMFFALSTIRYYSVPQRQREHALLAACVLADRLIA